MYNTPFVRSRAWHLRLANAVLPDEPPEQKLFYLGKNPLSLARTSDFVFGALFAGFIGCTGLLWPTLLKSSPLDIVVDSIGRLIGNQRATAVIWILIAVLVLVYIAQSSVESEQTRKAAKATEEQNKARGVTTFRANFVSYEVQYAFEGSENRSASDRLRSCLGFVLMALPLVVLVPWMFSIGILALAFVVDREYIRSYHKTLSRRQAVLKASITLFAYRIALMIVLLAGVMYTSLAHV